MVHEPVSIFLPSLYKHHFCFLSTGTGRTSLTRNSIPSKFRATVQSWIRGLAGSLRLNSPVIWPSVRTQFSLMTLMGSYWWFLPDTASFRRKLARCFGLSLIHPSLMYQATIPLSVERFTPNLSATNSNLLPHPQKHGLFALCVL